MKVWAVVGLTVAVLLVAAVVLFLPVRRGHAQVPSMTLVWTAPGDDGVVGTASSYQMRYRTVGIAGTDTLSWWNAATSAPNLPVPRVAGSTDSVAVAGPFVGGTTLYFLAKACDEVPNCSGYSNLAVKVVPDFTPPGRILDLIIR